MKSRFGAYAKLSAAMLIFGSIGLFVRHIPIPSSMIAFIRALVGVLFLGMIMLIHKKRLSAAGIKQNLPWLILSGTAIGFNWIFLFESYRYTSVAVSTLCYYMAPIIVTALSPLVLKEKLDARRTVCILLALLGMVLISGVLQTNSITVNSIKGIALGFCAAILYSTVILTNKKLQHIDATDRTVCQLGVSSLILGLYTQLTCNITEVTVTPQTIILLLIVGIVHTGLAYYLYFGAVGQLSGQSVAIASYIDPVVAVLVSVLLLREPLTLNTVIGTVTILSAAFVSELPRKERMQS